MIVDCFWFDKLLNFGHSGVRCAFLQQEQCPSLNWLAVGWGLMWPFLFPKNFSLGFSSVLPWFPFCNPRVGILCPVLVFVTYEHSSSSWFEILFWWSFKSEHFGSAIAPLFRFEVLKRLLNKVWCQICEITTFVLVLLFVRIKFQPAWTLSGLWNLGPICISPRSKQI